MFAYIKYMFYLCGIKIKIIDVMEKYKVSYFAKIYNGCPLYYVDALISKNGETCYCDSKKSALKHVDKKKAKLLNVKL